MSAMIPFEDVAPVKASSNILLLHQLQKLHLKSNINLLLAVLCLVYAGFNVVCFIINWFPEEFIEEHEMPFHMLEFWGTFGFGIVNVLSVMYSPKSLGQLYQHPIVLKIFLFLNVALSLIPALLLSIDIETFEKAGHEMEYCNELTQVVVDILILYSLFKGNNTSATMGGSIWFNVFLVVASGAVEGAQLCLYNLLPEEGWASGERIAHFCEFTFEFISACILFWFCVDNKILADRISLQAMVNGCAQTVCVCVDGSEGESSYDAESYAKEEVAAVGPSPSPF